MQKKQPTARSLNIFLIKEKTTTDEAIIPEVNSLTKHEIVLGPALKGRLYIKPSSPARPQWVDFFEGQIGLSDEDVISAASSAVFVVRRRKRIFALTFGYGRMLLNREAIEERFGLIVTLNSIDSAKIRTIDRKSLAADPRITREQASKEGSVESFSLNREHDLVRSLGGASVDDSLGTRLAGADSLAVSIQATLDDIPGLLDRCLDRWRNQGYKKRFPWIDYITEVNTATTLRLLEADLANRIRVGRLEKIWLAVPELLDWTDIAGFRFRDNKAAPLYPDIHLKSFLETARYPERLRVAYLKQRAVFCYSRATGFVVERWSVFRCLYAESELDGMTYLLSDGKWYRIEPSFVKLVDSDISRIKATSIVLPAYNDENEDAYNKRICRRSKGELALMHTRQIQYGGGSSSIEFCDAYSKKRIALHIKRYAGANALSHLFMQGANSAELLFFDREFRVALNRKLPFSHRLARPGKRLDARKYEIAFVIISQSKKELNLPFFSRLTLRDAYRRLSGYGYAITLTKVQAS